MKRTLSRIAAAASAAIATFGLAVGADLPATQTWVRPADWLAVPALSDNSYKAYFLCAVPENDAFFSIALSGSGFTANSITVDWGDGTTSVASAAGTWEKRLVYASLPAGSLSTRGWKQQLVTVTWPSAATGVGLSTPKPSNALVGLTSAQNYSSPVVDLGIAGANLTTIQFSSFSYTYRLLERAMVYKNGCNNTNSMWFQYCNRLRSVPVMYTSNLAYFANMFTECTALEVIEATLDLTKCTNAGSMFQNCSSLRAVPTLTGWGSTAGIDANTMFNSCYALQSIPLDFSKATSLTNAFATCYSLRALTVDMANCTTAGSMCSGSNQLVTVVIKNSTKVTQFTSAFSSCSALRNVTLPALPVCTSLNSLFANCYSLVTLPAIDAALCTSAQNIFTGCSNAISGGAVNLPVCTNMSGAFSYNYCLKTAPSLTFGVGKLSDASSMFNGCSNLTSVPNFDVSGVAYAQSMFASCTQLQYLPAYNFTSACTSFSTVFNNCTNLLAVPAWDMSGATTLGNLASQCYNLQRWRATGMKVSIQLSGNLMNATALAELFSNLASGVTGQTVTISGDPGATAGSGLDRTVATNKGWTVTG